MEFKWDEATILFYYLNVYNPILLYFQIFERSDEKLEEINL
jgi:hypothetical protein